MPAKAPLVILRLDRGYAAGVHSAQGELLGLSHVDVDTSGERRVSTLDIRRASPGPCHTRSVTGEEAAAAAGGIATSVSLVVIAWQAFLTRQSFHLQEQLAVEGTKSRLDARAPSISIEVADISRRPLEPTQFGEPHPVVVGMAYHRPEDDQISIMLRATLEIRNDGARAVAVTLSDSLKPMQRHNGASIGRRSAMNLAPGQAECAQLSGTMSIEECARNWYAQQSGKDLEIAASAEIQADDGIDDGVVDSWRVTIVGVPLAPLSEADDSWRMQEGANTRVEARVGGCNRAYYLSKCRGIRLPPLGG